MMQTVGPNGWNVNIGTAMARVAKPLIINLAATGMIPTRSQSPHVPLSVEEIVEDVCRCADKGVSMVHLHARGPDARPTTDKDIFSGIIAGIRERHREVVIIVTTSGRHSRDIEQRQSALHLGGPLKPDMASLTLGSMNFSREASMNSPEVILQLAKTMQALGIKPELEVFDLGMVNYGKHLIEKGVITPPFYFNILLGNIGTAQLNLLHLAAIVNELPAGSFWTLGGIGGFQAQANALAVVLGHGVRTGLEDNLWMDEERRKLATNTDLVDRCARISAALERPLASAIQVREWLGLDIRP